MGRNTDNQSEVVIKSHIQMPKLLLKRFHNSHNRFCYYDVEKEFIGTKGTAESTNTELGYFSKAMEEYLRDEIETPFSKVLSFLDTVDFDSECFDVSTDFSDTVKSFFYALMARDPVMMGSPRKDTGFFLLPQQYHDFSAEYGINYARGRNFFDKYILTFMVNKTGIPFVLPISGIYEYTIRKSSIVNLPISTTVAICLIHESFSDRIIRENGLVTFLLLDDPEKAKIMNEVAFQTQVGLGWGRVVCPERDELDRLMCLMQVKK